MRWGIPTECVVSNHCIGHAGTDDGWVGAMGVAGSIVRVSRQSISAAGYSERSG